MIKVTIKDAAALKSITVEQLKTYLGTVGWAKREDISRANSSGERTVVGEVWSQDVGPQVRTAIVVPSKESFADYAARISEALMSLEKAKVRSQLEVFVDITKTAIVIKPKKAKKSKKKS
jgi:hypothetical protein